MGPGAAGPDTGIMPMHVPISDIHMWFPLITNLLDSLNLHFVSNLHNSHIVENPLYWYWALPVYGSLDIPKPILGSVRFPNQSSDPFLLRTQPRPICVHPSWTSHVWSKCLKILDKVSFCTIPSLEWSCNVNVTVVPIVYQVHQHVLPRLKANGIPHMVLIMYCI